MSMWRQQRGRLCCLVRPEQQLLLPEREPIVQCRTVTQTRSPSVIWNQQTPSPSFADSTGSVISFVEAPEITCLRERSTSYI
eukprot:COSAG06_NODE_3274_length_5576_cov_2.383942_3_plen_82_part_00